MTNIRRWVIENEKVLTNVLEQRFGLQIDEYFLIACDKSRGEYCDECKFFKGPEGSCKGEFEKWMMQKSDYADTGDADYPFIDTYIDGYRQATADIIIAFTGGMQNGIHTKETRNIR